MAVTRKIRVLLAKLGLDVHNRGVLTVAKELRDAGMEVLYVGNALPREIASAAVEEHADAIGVSSLGGAHLTLGRALLEAAADVGIRDETVFLIGGVFSPEDGETLRDIGFEGVFPPGSTRDEIVTGLRDAVARKQEGRGT